MSYNRKKRRLLAVCCAAAMQAANGFAPVAGWSNSRQRVGNAAFAPPPVALAPRLTRSKTDRRPPQPNGKTLLRMASGSLFQAEVLTDLSHVALDLGGFVLTGGSSNGDLKLGVRMAGIVGRVMAMAADYIPDHNMLPEELVFQLFMLTVGLVGLARSALPLALASMHKNVTLRDGKAFSLLFEPAGFTWSQFKAMRAVCLDWVMVDSGELLLTSEANSEQSGGGDYTYWLFNGQVAVEHQGTQVFELSRTSNTTGSNKQNAAQGLIGESRLLKKLGIAKKSSSLPSSSDKQTASASRPEDSTTSRVSGSDGATLLRIDNTKLKILFENDDELAHATRTLVFQSMQDKLAARLQGA